MANKIPRVPVREQDPAIRATNFEEVCYGYDLEEATLEASRCLRCKNPRCVAACPVGIRIPDFIAALHEGRLQEAADIISEDSSLPSICGRVCPQESQCELRHQKYSYNSILEDIRKEHSNIPNLYNILISYQVTKAFDSELGNYKTDWIFNNYCANDFNIHIYDINDTGSLFIDYDYLIDKYFDDDVICIQNRIVNMVKQILANNDINSCDIEIVTPEEKNTILNVFNNTNSNYPRDCMISQLFEKQVEKTPDNIAVVFGDDKLTYRQLNEKANSLAYYLRNTQHVEKESLVGVMVNRSLEMIIAILAVMKSGGAYIPIDPSFPEDRINYMLSSSSASVLLTSKKLESKIDFELVECIINTKADLNVANKNFEQAEGDLIDYYSYQIKANKAKLDYLIKEVKQKGFSLDTINELKLRIS